MNKVNLDLTKTIGSLRHVWHGGPIGKKALVGIVTQLSALVITVTALGVLWPKPVFVFVFAAISLASLYFICRHVNGSIDLTLEQHPQLAVLDQSGVLEYRRMEIAAKGTPAYNQSPAIPNPRGTQALLPDARSNSDAMEEEQ